MATIKVTAGKLKMGDVIIVNNNGEHQEWTVTNAHSGTPSTRKVFTTNASGKKKAFDFGMMVELNVKIN